MDINTEAPVITRDEIVISAPIETIWAVQTDVDGWPAWQPDVDGARADGPLAPGSVFRWQTAGLDITSTVEEVDAPRRIVWGGPAQGIGCVPGRLAPEPQARRGGKGRRLGLRPAVRRSGPGVP